MPPTRLEEEIAEDFSLLITSGMVRADVCEILTKLKKRYADEIHKFVEREDWINTERAAGKTYRVDDLRKAICRELKI